MTFLDSLLDAIIRLDGDALVMHVGEKPYVTTPARATEFRGPLAWGQVELSSRPLTVETVLEMLAQILPPDLRPSLEVMGAIEHDIEGPGGERFVLTAARGGDDVWVEVRRRTVMPEPQQQPEPHLEPEPPAQSVPEPVAAPEPTVAQAATATPPAGTDSEQEPVVAIGAEQAVPSEQELESEAPPHRQPAVHALAPAPIEQPAPPEQRDEFLTIDSSDEILHFEIVDDVYEIAGEADVHEIPADDWDEVSLPAATAVPPELQHVTAASEPAAAARSPEPVGADAPEPSLPSSSPEPVFAAAESPVPGPMPEPSAVAVPEPVAVVVPEPVAVAVPEPVAVAVPEPVAVAVPEPVAVAVPEPVAVAEPEPAAVVVPEPVAVAVPEPVAVAEPEPVAVAVPEPPVVAPAAERVIPTAPEPVTAAQAPAAEPIVAVAPESTVAPPAPEPAVVAAAPEPVATAPPESAVVLPIGRPPLKIQPPPPPVDVAEPAAATPSLVAMLKSAAERGAATAYAVARSRPFVRIEGEVVELAMEPVVTTGDIERFAFEFAPRNEHGEAASEWVCSLPDVGRVRAVAFDDEAGPGLVLHIAANVSTAEAMGLSHETQKLCSEADGLVLVTGPRRNGKSTLLGAFVDLINRRRTDYVVTIESRIRALYDRRHALISQREVDGDGESIARAARAALREGPDVLVLDDIRAPEAVVVAIDAARSGRLVIAAIAAPSAASAIDRLIEGFPTERRPQVRALLASSLRGVVSQVLVEKKGGGRVGAREVLLGTPAVCKLVLDGATAQLGVAMESATRAGMRTLPQALALLVRDGVIDVEEAYRHVTDHRAFLLMLQRESIDVSDSERRA